MQKNELMSILDDSVEEVKKQIMRRRVKQEAEYSSRKSTLDHGASEQAQFEVSISHTLYCSLSDFISE